MIATLKIISEKLESYEKLNPFHRSELLKNLQQLATIEALPEKCEGESVCPVTKEMLRRPCGLKSCKFWVDHGWTKNCALNFLLSQEKEKLSVAQVSLLYKKSPERVDSIFKKCFKIVQRHYLHDTLRSRNIPQFHHVPGFCVACESRLTAEETGDPTLRIDPQFGYCSTECKKQYPPQYFEIESSSIRNSSKWWRWGRTYSRFSIWKKSLAFSPMYCAIGWKNYALSLEGKSPPVEVLLDVDDFKAEQSFDTSNQEKLICPFCGVEHDPDDFQLGRKSKGTLKCGSCGEAFEFEAIRKTTYNTFCS